MLRLPGCLGGLLLLSHRVHLLVVISVLVFKRQLWILLDAILDFLGFETDDIELAILLAIDVSLVKGQAIVAIAR